MISAAASLKNTMRPSESTKSAAIEMIEIRLRARISSSGCSSSGCAPSCCSRRSDSMIQPPEVSSLGHVAPVSLGKVTVRPHRRAARRAAATAQRRARALAEKRHQEDARQPHRPVWPEELRDYVRAAARRPRAAIADRRRYARVRGSGDAASASADRQPRQDLAAGALVRLGGGRREAATLDPRAHKARAPARTHLAAPAGFPVWTSPQQRRLWSARDRWLAWCVPRAALLGA